MALAQALIIIVQYRKNGSNYYVPTNDLNVILNK
ncbi:MAG: hypothetical protein Ta2E_09550 [Mycoplasmoidaceae bacterium]|nr:MAG: hypothetical protein Ta2E_09550 [Mycoplasmoidaceae bacterium]